MAEAADYGLMMWDATSTGTLGNVIELPGRKKKSAVFVNKSKEFMTVGDVAPMSSIGRPWWRAYLNLPGRRKMRAHEKWNLHKRIEALSHGQMPMFA